MRCGSPEKTREQLRAWYERLPGEWLAEDEIGLLDGILPTLFGYNLMQMGVSYPDDCLAKSKIPNQILMDVDSPPCLDHIRESSVHRRISYFCWTVCISY